jgi:hypothetical protein
VATKTKFKSQDEDPSKDWSFLQYKKANLEIKTGNTTVGSILGAMLYQICADNNTT